ncbi:MAG: exopolysaccharide biosynthesis polyprenyl glycosylphosphotransferase [Lysobacterales bacterium]|nr:MAG: exopolysaccharide biosynthesis polyprenyl glycosylphosphotransferase [Xanthomonadales bacterium]
MKPFKANTLILGAGPFIRDLLAEIERHPACRYRIAGVVAWEDMDEAGGCGYPVLGTVDHLHRIIQQHETQVIIVAPPDGSAKVTDRQLLEARVLHNVRVEHAQAVYEQVTGKLPLETFAPEDVIYSNDFQPNRTALMATRLLSLGFAGAGLILLAPLMLLIGLLIRIDSAGPVLFSQERSGLAGRPFKLLKFRTMEPAEEQQSEWEEDNVHRITRVGRWLRKCRLDELPQFFNILNGDMNIVGPRPHPSSNFELFVLAARNTPESGIQIPYYSMRYSVRPGITGWAQVRYRYANNLNEEMEKLRFDLYYLKHYSLWLDIRILVETVTMIFARSHRVQDQTTDRLQEQALVPDTATDLPDMAGQIHPAADRPRQQAFRRRNVA